MNMIIQNQPSTTKSLYNMLPHIQTAVVHVSSLVELASIVKKVKEDVTFLGHRYIYVKGYEGTLSINALALSIMFLVRKNIDFDQHPKERDALNDMIPLISKIYTGNDARWKNPVTLTLRSIRDVQQCLKKENLHFWGYDVRFNWKDDYVDGYDFSAKYYRPLCDRFLKQMTREQIQPVLANISSLSDVFPIIKKAKEEISFFGCRYISVEGYDGALPIHALSARVMELAKTTLNTSQKDLLDQEIVPLIDEIYRLNEERTKEKNAFTRILCGIRDIWIVISNKILLILNGNNIKIYSSIS